MKRVQLYALFYSYFFLLFTIKPIQAQGDPLQWTEPVSVEANDLFLLWLEDVGPSVKSYQKVYRYKIDSTWLPLNQLISETPRQEDNRPANNSNLQFCDVASGCFNVDPYDDLVAVWTGQGSSINIMIPQFDTTEAMWTTSVQASIDNVNPYNRIYVRTGDFDADSLDEFVVTRVNQNNRIWLHIYDVDSTIQPSLIASFWDEVIYDYVPGEWFVNYFIETGDFNGDGKDEILLQFLDENPQTSGWTIRAKIYELNDSTIVPKARRSIFPEPVNSNVEAINMAVAKGQFNNASKNEIAFSIIYRGNGIGGSPFGDWSLLYLLEVSPDLMQIDFDPSEDNNLWLGDGSSFNPNYLGLATGDLNGDGRDEIVLNSGYPGNYNSKVHVYEADDDLNLYYKVGETVYGGSQDWFSHNFLKVADVNLDNKKDIVIIKNWIDWQPRGFSAQFFSASSNLDELVEIGRLRGDEPQNNVGHPFAVALGNFDACNFTIGQPTHSSVYDIVQPIVILNAPPDHFDKFGSDIFDVNNCYNGGDCDFVSTYIKQNTTSIEVSTKVHKDWVISSGIEFSGSATAAPLGIGATVNIDGHFLLNYGRHFSKDSTNITTVSVGVEVQAREDDQIYTTVTDYDLWEYPLYYGNESFSRRSVLTLVPNSVQGTWFPSKSYTAVSYVPDHEVSNILSYQAYDTLDHNPNLSQTIRANYVSDSFVLSANTSYDWNLAFSDFTSTQADTVRENGLDYSNLVAGLFRFNFDFTETNVVTHTTSVSELIDLNVHLGSVDLGIGDTKYTVTPYAYWATNDALVVDYAAKPELAPPGFPETWWQQMYGGSSDPAFILPWRLDPEKGFSLSEPAKRFQTKDIVFTPARPVLDDTLTITAYVRNFSLIPTPTSVSVKFFIGDPDSSGTPIIGINGTNTASTNGPVLERSRSAVEFKWIVPSGLPSYPRIYAVLDQENGISEIHEDNNKGFNVLGAPSVSGVENENYLIPKDYVLYQSYPNPFNPTTTIKYAIPSSDKVSIIIYDILGREVATLVNEYKNAGTHTVEFNATGFASGIYFYQINSGNFIDTKKMVMVK